MTRRLSPPSRPDAVFRGSRPVQCAKPVVGRLRGMGGAQVLEERDLLADRVEEQLGHVVTEAEAHHDALEGVRNESVAT